MITLFHHAAGKIAELQVSGTYVIPDEPVWIDLYQPTDDELRLLPQYLNIALPGREEIWRNHALSRLYSRDGNAYMTASVLYDGGEARTGTVTFILTPDFLITIRDIDPPAFLRLQETILLTPKRFPCSDDVLEGLLEEIITGALNDHARVLQGVEAASTRIFAEHAFESGEGNPSLVMRSVLRELGRLADLNSKINESTHSLTRMLAFIRDEQAAPDSLIAKDADRMRRDAVSLSEQSTFLIEKINFLLSSALGMINVEQNLIAKIFSVVALIFLPPSLVVGFWGMNFKHMPELDWQYGYALAIGVMFVFAVLPYVYFRHRRWL